ncbi:MAG: hypothetical protein P8Z73_16090 [Desulfobacteraceae bacterium]
MKANIGVKMRSGVRFGLVFWMVMVICGGCAGSPDAAKTIPATINTVEPAKGFTKTIAVVLTYTTDSDFGRRIGDIYFRALLDALQEQDPGLQLVTRTSGQLPDSLEAMAQEGPRPARAFELSETARIAGLNGWACARIESLQPVARKTGILWFRKERYFIFAELSFSVYDPFTGAKIVDKVVENETPVSRADYDAVRTGKSVAIADLDETVADIGADIGEHTAEILEQQYERTGQVTPNVHRRLVRDTLDRLPATVPEVLPRALCVRLGLQVLGGNFSPRNISHMPAVKISARLKLDENVSFLDGPLLSSIRFVQVAHQLGIGPRSGKMCRPCA